jgi:MYXO-CTERM domain-containing protein
MNLKIGLSALITASAVTSVSSASIIVFDQRSTWETFSGAYGNYVFDENFNDIADGLYPSPFAHTTGPVDWSAAAPGGLYVSGGEFSTNLPELLSFSFSGAPVYGVGGNFFGTDVSFNVVPALLFISLSDGTTYAGVVSNPNTFTGFYSTGAAITGLTVQAVSSLVGGGAVFATVDDMAFATPVPGPGALALLGLAGAITGRRRR